MDEKELNKWIRDNKGLMKEYDNRMREERRKHPLTFGP